MKVIFQNYKQKSKQKNIFSEMSLLDLLIKNILLTKSILAYAFFHFHSGARIQIIIFIMLTTIIFYGHRVAL